MAEAEAATRSNFLIRLRHGPEPFFSRVGVTLRRRREVWLLHDRGRFSPNTGRYPIHFAATAKKGTWNF
jgi:hypothetical protein